MQFSQLPRRTRALTLIEVLVVVAVLVLVAVLALSYLSEARRNVLRLDCVMYLKNDGLAIRVWAGDHNDHRPQNLSVANGGAKEFLAAGNVASYFQVMSNDSFMPFDLTCPVDRGCTIAKSFATLKNTNIDYFVSPNPDNSQPNAIMFGDDNLMVDGTPIKSGVMNLWTNRSIAWTNQRHRLAGDVALFDGSVALASNAGLTNLVAEPGTATNMVVIP